MSLLTNIPNKIYIIGFALFFLLLILEETTDLSLPYLGMAGIIFTVLILGFLMKNGHYFHSKWFSRSQFAAPFLIIGALFKIQHYPYSFILLSAAFAIILFCYIAYFFSKKHKNVIDVLKLLWFASELVGRFLKLNHFPYGAELVYYISPLLLFLLLSMMITNGVKQNPNWVHQ